MLTNFIVAFLILINYIIYRYSEDKRELTIELVELIATIIVVGQNLVMRAISGAKAEFEVRKVEKLYKGMRGQRKR